MALPSDLKLAQRGCGPVPAGAACGAAGALRARLQAAVPAAGPAAGGRAPSPRRSHLYRAGAGPPRPRLSRAPSPPLPAHWLAGGEGRGAAEAGLPSAVRGAPAGAGRSLAVRRLQRRRRRLLPGRPVPEGRPSRFSVSAREAPSPLGAGPSVPGRR